MGLGNLASCSADVTYKLKRAVLMGNGLWLWPWNISELAIAVVGYILYADYILYIAYIEKEKLSDDRYFFELISPRPYINVKRWYAVRTWFGRAP